MKRRFSHLNREIRRIWRQDMKEDNEEGKEEFELFPFKRSSLLIWYLKHILTLREVLTYHLSSNLPICVKIVFNSFQNWHGGPLDTSHRWWLGLHLTLRPWWHQNVVEMLENCIFMTKKASYQKMLLTKSAQHPPQTGVRITSDQAYDLHRDQ